MSITIAIPTPIAEILIAFILSYLSNWAYDRLSKKH